MLDQGVNTSLFCPCADRPGGIPRPIRGIAKASWPLLTWTMDVLGKSQALQPIDLWQVDLRHTQLGGAGAQTLRMQLCQVGSSHAQGSPHLRSHGMTAGPVQIDR